MKKIYVLIKLDLWIVDIKTKVKSKTFSNLKHNSIANVYNVAENLMDNTYSSLNYRANKYNCDYFTYEFFF